MINDLEKKLSKLGMILRGGCYLEKEEAQMLGGESLLLIGNAGSEMFNAMEKEAFGEKNPMDSWTRCKLTPLAAETGAKLLLPFDGPPWHPFQKWARACEDVAESPVRMMIHPDYGLWHAYRGAFLFPGKIALPEKAGRASPCAPCPGPCRASCPVGAFSDQGYDVAICTAHVVSPAGAPCRTGGCLARRACPAGDAYRYDKIHAAFHMSAFINAR